jgi:hypothetical protein
MTSKDDESEFVSSFHRLYSKSGHDGVAGTRNEMGDGCLHDLQRPGVSLLLWRSRARVESSTKYT